MTTNESKSVTPPIEFEISKLKLAEYNPRMIDADDLDGLARSIKEFGFVEPVVVNSNSDRTNTVIGGHQRIRAAKKLGMDKVPCVFVDLDEPKEKALNIALNKISGEWDFKKLQELMVELTEIPNIDPTVTGFGRSEIDGLISDFDETMKRHDKAEKLKTAMMESGINPAEAESVANVFEHAKEANKDTPNVDMHGETSERMLVAFWIDDHEDWEYLRSVYATGRDIEQDEQKLLSVTRNAAAHDHQKLIAITKWYEEVYLKKQPNGGTTSE